MRDNLFSTGQNLRVIWFIAAKDIQDALRNKTTFSVLIGVLFMMLTSQALPWILGLQDLQRVIVFDAGDSGFVEQLREDPRVSVAAATNLDNMSKFLGESAGTWLGLVLPNDFPENAGAENPIHLEGFSSYGAQKDEVAKTVAFFETLLTQLAGVPVQIDTAGNTVYPVPDSGGRPFMVGLTLTLIVLTVSAFLVPYLMIEEKEAHTMDVLLVSPARIGQVVLGKAIAGMVYGLAAASVVLAFSGNLVVHWGWALTAVLAGTLFATAIGLLMGSIFDNPQNLSLWLGITLVLFISPILLDLLPPANLPQWAQTVLPWTPTIQLSDLFRMTFSRIVPLEAAFFALAILAVSTGLLLAAVTWRIRLLDR